MLGEVHITKYALSSNVDWGYHQKQQRINS